jgi:hypothetical protein
VLSDVMQADTAQNKKSRGAIELPGYITVAGEEPLPCIISDESSSRASILTRNTKTPDCFNLIMIGRGDLSQPCTVARRIGNTIGVHFIRSIDRRV